MISNAEIIDALGRVSEALREPSHEWVVFIETTNLDGAMSYTYRMGEAFCDTPKQAIEQAVGHLTFIDPDITMIRGAFAVRREQVFELDCSHFRRTPQFQVR